MKKIFRVTEKINLNLFQSKSDFDELYNTWNIEVKEKSVFDRVRTYIDDPENPGEKIETTKLHKTMALCFDLKVVKHNSFNFYIYDDYENKNLIYFTPALYYYGNYVRDYAYYLVTGDEQIVMPFNKYCQDLANKGDKFAMHNYKIDMETVEEFNLLR